MLFLAMVNSKPHAKGGGMGDKNKVKWVKIKRKTEVNGGTFDLILRFILIQGLPILCIVVACKDQLRENRERN